MKLIFLGPQGSGKSTQARMLADKLNLPYIEMGQIFRDRANESDDVAAKIKSSLNKGELVADEITTSTLKDELSQPKYSNGYVLDGYPRNIAQFNSLEEVDKVFYVSISDQEAVKRLLLRKREDDTKELLEKRLEIYHSLTEPLLEMFKAKSKLVEINGEQSIEQVSESIQKELK